MAQPLQTFDSYDAIGNREDLSDIIYNISPMETPCLSSWGRGVATSTKHEWQNDELVAASDSNAVIEGDIATHDSIAATARRFNWTQISDKVVVIAGTQDAVDKAGRRSELAYQLSKRAKELKRDMEATITRNKPIEDGDGSTARTLGSFETWISANEDRGTNGLHATDTTVGQPDLAAAPTDGTLRALTESMVKGVIKSCWTEGGDPGMLVCGPFNKQAVSAFTGNSTRFDKGEDKRLVSAIDVYVSDFGDHRIVPNRFSRGETLLVCDPRYWSVDYLRGFRQWPLAKDGDTEKRQLLVEYTLRSSQQKASGVVADLTIS